MKSVPRFCLPLVAVLLLLSAAPPSSGQSQLGDIVVGRLKALIEALQRVLLLSSKRPTFEDQQRESARQFVDELNQKTGGKWTAHPHERFSVLTTEAKRRLAGIDDEEHFPEVLQKKTESWNGTTISLSIESSAGRKKRTAVGVYNAKTTNTSASSNHSVVTCTSTTQFDSRTQWPGCAAIIGVVQDQSNCSDCWAVSTASVFQDRNCIQRAKQGLATNASDPGVHFSAVDILSCTPSVSGCNGGSPFYAWNYVRSSGVVSGGTFASREGCKPYPFPPNSTVIHSAPNCTATCTNGAHVPERKLATWTSYMQNSASTVQAIQAEIRANGSVVATMHVYEDFMHYSSGVYSRVSGTYLGGHAIRLIGWGVQNCSDGSGQPFWLGLNSWNTDWGERGYFRIASGVDECGIESLGVFFGTPQV